MYGLQWDDLRSGFICVCVCSGCVFGVSVCVCSVCVCSVCECVCVCVRRVCVCSARVCVRCVTNVDKHMHTSYQTIKQDDTGVGL